MVGSSILTNVPPDAEYDAEDHEVCRVHSAERLVIEIAITNEQAALPVDEPRLRAAVEGVFRAAGRERATISVAVVDDSTIHEINRRHLAHDYPTDVLSFLLDDEGGVIDGEIVVSGDHAVTFAADYDWAPADELLLYVIHGALHLVGYDDHEEADRARMRQAESEQLVALGVAPHDRPRGAEAAARVQPARRLSREGSAP